MQFSTVALFAAAAALVAADVTETDLSTTLVTLTECPETVTNCPARVSTSVVAAQNISSAANVSTYEGAGAKVQFAAGAAALAAGALLAL
ncbi:uncharacterized protein RJT21DRAFT_120360 [Scheffersomyces amazonensis]|uniref:uncharacterized protein n=1 Tax=Scheffersomyces amazonensis TaxID=1078765 RepID=UPI00315D9855